MKYKYILFFIILLTACKQKRQVQTAFYYWKTVYQRDSLENNYLEGFKSDRLYVRVMDVDDNLALQPVPVAAIGFAEPLPSSVHMVPVVFIVNEVLKTQNEPQLKHLARQIVTFVDAKVKQAGKSNYQELQIDCDWTATTRDRYFFMLKEIAKLNKGKSLSSTLRLHQLKNQEKSGIPPVDQVVLMCYNMGNLRKYGPQNSILDVAELKKYAGKNLGHYPLQIDIALPLFSWAVVFRGTRYQGISKRIKLADLKNHQWFKALSNGLYVANVALPSFGLLKDDVVRFEDSKLHDLQETAAYLSANLSAKPINLVFYHLDQQNLKNYPLNELEEITRLLH